MVISSVKILVHISCYDRYVSSPYNEQLENKYVFTIKFLHLFFSLDFRSVSDIFSSEKYFLYLTLDFDPTDIVSG